MAAFRLALCAVGAAAVAMASREEIVLESGGATTPITRVAMRHATFGAAVSVARGDHRGELRTTVPTVSGELLEVVTTPNKRLFSPRAPFTAIGADGVAEAIDLDKALFHAGSVVGEQGSHVHFSVHQSGGVDGVVRRADGTKVVLSSLARYSGVTAPEHHDTVVYDASDLTEEALHGMRDALAGAGCPVEGLSRTASDAYNATERAAFEAGLAVKHAEWAATESARRARRGDGDGDSTPEQCDAEGGGLCSCSVALLGDHFFYMGPHAQQNVRYGMQHMVNVLVEADSIYRATDFSGVVGLGFVVHSGTVYTTTGGGNPTPLSTYADGTAYLNAVTSGLKNRNTDVCTSIVFTHRDFQEGILGMAWVAEPTGYGGICDPVFNVGFNTGVNFGQVVTPFVASLVFAHEVGHNWGAEHDPDGSSCAPGDDNGGNYIMYAAASDGTHPNNRAFSACSTAQMATVVGFLREGCFVEAGVGCGDGEVSGDEECDCGDECTPTSCCTSDCRVNRQLYQCSPQNPIRYPCCTLQCMYATAGTRCHSGDDCAEEAYCSGSNASCPLDPRDDDTPCNCLGDDCDAHPNTNPQVCDRGVCTKFVCEQWGAVQCGLTVPHTCELGCRGEGWGDGFECVSTFDSSKTPDGFSGGRYYVPGTPCRHNLGRCDQRGQCVTVDQSDGLNPRDAAQQFVQDNVVAVFGGVAAAVLVVLAALHYRQHRITVNKWRESERAYLLAAANAEAEASEEMLANGGDSDREDFDSPDYAVPMASVPVGGGGGGGNTVANGGYLDVGAS